MKKYSFFLFLLILCTGVKSQTIIKADLKTFVNVTLDRSPIVRRSQLNVKNAQGGVQFQKGAFDYQLVSGVAYDKSKLNLFDADARNKYILGKLKTNKSKASIALQKKFRTGLSSSLSFDYSLSNDNFPINQFNQNVGSYINNHSLSTTFSLTQPIMRGGDSNVANALEESAKLNFESAKSTYELASSYEVYKMGLAYWQYVASYETLKAYQQNQQRVEKILEITDELVKADKKPAGDLIQVNADLANQKRQTMSAEQNYYNAKINLGRVIGFSEKESEVIGVPENPFPAISGIDVLSKSSEYINILSEIAIENRKDIAANRKAEEALELRRKLAENDKKPQLDLTGFVRYGGMNMGNGLDEVFATFYNREGQSLEIGLNLKFSIPFSNNRARGAYTQNLSQMESQRIQNDNLKRNINMNVSIAHSNLIKSISILNQAKGSLDSYTQVYENEKVKFQNGLTTLLNLALFQERLVTSQIQYIVAQQQFANAIAELRYETGTLINSNKVDAETAFYTVPKK